MNIKQVAQAVVDHDGRVSCKVLPKKNQILLRCTVWPEETVVLLSPHYQLRLAAGEFGAQDLDGVLIEVDRIIRFGM